MSIGDRIRSARQLRGLSLRALATEIGKSHEAVRQYENGDYEPDSTALLNIAQSLDVGLEYFFREEYVSKIEIPAYRSHPDLGVKARRRITEMARDAVERYLEIARLLQDEGAVRPLPGPFNVEQSEEAESIAEKLRKIWGLGNEPISSLVSLLESHGVPVLELEDEPGFDACTLSFESRDGRGHIILVNPNAPGDRMRFSIAHELGHLVIAAGHSVDEEVAANRFAAAFIVPAWAAFAELGENRTEIDLTELYSLKHRYGLSMQSWLHRARELGIISENAARHMRRELDGIVDPKVEPGTQLPRETPTKFLRMIGHAFSEGVITTSKAAELSRKPIEYWRDPSRRLQDALRH